MCSKEPAGVCKQITGISGELRIAIQTSQLTKICELAPFSHTAEVGMCYKTIQDMDDRVKPPTCREYTHPRADPEPMQQFQEEE